MEDEQIVELYWQRSESAVSETEKKHGAYCRYIAYHILRSGEDSEECVNDTYLKAWESMPPRRPSCLRTFLGRITRNLSLNLVRHNKAAKRDAGQLGYILEELGECAAPGDEMERVEDRALIVSVLDRFLAALPRRDRMVFVRRYWYFSSVAEIAGEYGLSQSNVKMILSRARGRLKTELEQEGISV